VETAVCIITGIGPKNWTAISISDTGFSFTTTTSWAYPNGQKRQRKNTQIIIIIMYSVTHTHTQSTIFYCLTVHFNSLNLTYQLMHFYIQ